MSRLTKTDRVMFFMAHLFGWKMAIDRREVREFKKIDIELWKKRSGGNQ